MTRNDASVPLRIHTTTILSVGGRDIDIQMNRFTGIFLCRKDLHRKLQIVFPKLSENGVTRYIDDAFIFSDVDYSWCSFELISPLPRDRMKLYDLKQEILYGHFQGHSKSKVR